MSAVNNDARRLIADSINRIFADHVDRSVLDAMQAGQWPHALWNQVAEAGFQHVLDGAGEPALDWQEAAAVLFACGYHRAPVPLPETMLANWMCARAGLPVGAGPATVIDGSALSCVADAGAAPGHLRLSGSVWQVPWARFAQRLVIATRHAGQAVLAVVEGGGDGPHIEAGHNVASEPRDTVRFDRVAARAVPFDPVPGHNAVLLYGALMRAVGLAGAATSVLDQSVLYVNDRIQFGRPIGKFQAVQHLLAELGSEAAAASMAATAACAVAGQAEAAIEIAIAKVRTGQAAQRVARIAHQVHGAIGFTHEHSLHYGTQRLWSWRAEFGNDATWARVIGAAACTIGGAQLWPQLMTRSS